MTNTSQSAGGEAYRDGGPLPNLEGRLTSGLAPTPPLSDEATTRLGELRELRKSDPKTYWSQSVQDEELALLSGQRGEVAKTEGEAETEAKAEPDEQEAETEQDERTDDLAEVQARLKEIADARRTDRRSYTAVVEKEELGLLDRREILEAGAEHLPPELVAAWRASGGLKFNADRARATAETMLADLDEGERANFTAKIDALPAGARTALYSHLALDAPTHRPANAADVEKFASTPEGKELVDAWARAAPRKVAAVKARMAAIMSAMPSPEDRSAAETWINGLTAPHAKAMWRALAG
jgi:hypothetical protein